MPGRTEHTIPGRELNVHNQKVQTEEKMKHAALEQSTTSQVHATFGATRYDDNGQQQRGACERADRCFQA
jgi:hypothetical protein